MAAVNDLVKKIDNVPSIEQFDAEWNVASCSARIRRVFFMVTIDRDNRALEGINGLS